MSTDGTETCTEGEDVGGRGGDAAGLYVGCDTGLGGGLEGAEAVGVGFGLGASATAGGLVLSIIAGMV